MTALILGLLLFIAAHASRLVAEGPREAFIRRHGPLAWKAAHSLVSALGLGLIVIGYAAARAEPVLLWSPPPATRHVAALLTLPAFILLAAAYVPGNALRARLGHPMTLAVKLWALAHLLANGSLADLLLFGSLLAWSVLLFRAARRRPAAPPAPSRPLALVGVLLAGLGAWALFAFHLHAAWIGVAPFGR